MLDFKISDDLDIVIADGIAGEQENNVTTLLTALFTDSRSNSHRGYWLDAEGSLLWTHEQARISDLSARNLTESAKTIAAGLVSDGLFHRIDALATAEDGVMYMRIRCYNDGQRVLNRKFRV